MPLNCSTPHSSLRPHAAQRRLHSAPRAQLEGEQLLSNGGNALVVMRPLCPKGPATSRTEPPRACTALDEVLATAAPLGADAYSEFGREIVPVEMWLR